MAVFATVLVTSCGGNTPAPPNTPTPPVTPPVTPTPPPPTWSVSGRLVDTVNGQPVAGAQVTPTWDLPATTTAADGTFSLGSTTNPPTTPYPLLVTGPGLVDRRLWVRWQSGARTDVTVDAIRNQPPFSLEFYRQFVRGTYDGSAPPYAIFRWMDSPRFYVKTVDQNGRAIEPEVMAVVLEAIPRSVSEYSAGRLSVTTLETGTADRAPASGWINVTIRREPDERRVCGFANIGANPGSITLHNDVCSCGSNKIPGSLVMHEIGHALGYFHVPDANSVMYPFISGRCPAGTLSAAEKYHAAIAYSRPRGNLDPDNDPSTTSAAMPVPSLWTDR